MSVAAVSGVATFSNLSIGQVGVGYTLTATDDIDLPPTTSATFDITEKPASVVVVATPANIVFPVVVAINPAEPPSSR